MTQTTSDQKKTLYCREYPEGLGAGQQIKIEASLPKDSASFMVNFLCGREEKADSALWLSFKLGDPNMVIVNNFLDKTSGKKEIHHNVPLARGEDFYVVFIIEKETYKMLINGEELCQWKHGVSAEQVRFLQVEGDVDVKAVTVTGEKEQESIAGSDGAHAIHPKKVPMACCCPGRQTGPCCIPCQPCCVCYCITAPPAQCHPCCC